MTLKQRILAAARAWAEAMVTGTEESRDEAGLVLIDAVNALKEKEAKKHGHKNPRH